MQVPYLILCELFDASRECWEVRLDFIFNFELGSQASDC